MGVIIILGAWVGVANDAAAMSWDDLSTRYFRHLSVPKDIPSVVTAIAQDKRGFLWLGTEDGLVRWDGYRAKLFVHENDDHHSLPANLVTGLLVNEQGELLVTTGDGTVARYDAAREQFSASASTTSGTGIYSAFVSDGAGGVWLGNGNGLSHLAGNAQYWENIELPDHARVWSLLRSRDGTIWAGTDQGLLYRAPGDDNFVRASPERAGSSLVSVIIRSLMETKGGEIWFGTNDGRIGARNGQGHVRQIETPPGSQILSLVEDLHGIVCAGTGGTGLIFIDETSGKMLQTARFDASQSSGLSDDYIYSLFVDGSGGLWVGNGHGLDYAPPSDGAFQSILRSSQASHGLSNSHISSIGFAPNGKIWIGGDNADDLISQVDGKAIVQHQHFQSGDALPNALVHSIVTTDTGESWLATGQGLYEYRNGHLQKFPPLAGEPVRTLLADGNTLWIGLDKRGLMKLDLATRALNIYQHDRRDPLSIADNFVLGLLRDPQHGLWIATNHGVSLYDGRRFLNFVHDPADKNSLPADIAVSLQLDRWQRLWVGTFGGGIAILEGDPFGSHRFLNIGRASGIPSANIGAMLTGADGDIWAGTDSGLAKIDPKNLTVRAFTAADGLAVTGYLGNSGIGLPDGTLMFGGVGGLTLVHPERISEWSFTPEVVATSIRVGPNYLPATQTLTLSADDRSLQVEFSALDYTAPERNKYAYKLEGFDSEWVSTDSDHRLAAYTNLPPGKYALLLRGSNRAGVWSSPTRLDVTVEPAWYQTLWFKTVLILVAIAGVVLLVRSRTAFLRRRQKELEGQVAERTAAIASLLDNSGEGFLSFGADFVVDRQYSKACELFLGESPAGKDAIALLFAENARHATFAAESLPSALSTPDTFKRDLILSLLPKEIDRRARRLRVQYTAIENGHLMVVLRDITTERRLAERIASEHRRLGLIVAAITNSRDFFDALEALQHFLDFMRSPDIEEQQPETYQSVYRQVHTLKGVFNQLSFEKIPATLNEMEERLDDLRRSAAYADVKLLIASTDLEGALQQDLSVIRTALGQDFVSKGGQVTMTVEQATQIKQIAHLWRTQETFDLDQSELRDLLGGIDKLGCISLKQELSRYDQTIAQVALRLEKEVAPLVVSGANDIWIDPDRYGPFLRSLVHVFRNCVAHGIEPPDSRVENGKNELGQITCEIHQEGDMLRLTVSDDGQGVDLPALGRILVDQGVYSADTVRSLSDEELLGHIFRDRVSTVRDVDEWAGRGVGLAAVKEQVEKLGGKVTVETTAGQGTRFVFLLKLASSAYAEA